MTAMGNNMVSVSVKIKPSPLSNTIRWMNICLTHWGRVTHICVSKLGHHWFILCHVAWPAPNHDLNQCWNIVNTTRRISLKWNINRNPHISIYDNAFGNVVFEMAAILSRSQCDKPNLVVASVTDTDALSPSVPSQNITKTSFEN